MKIQGTSSARYPASRKADTRSRRRIARYPSPNRAISPPQHSSGLTNAPKALQNYIKALNDVIALCESIELDRYGKRPGEGEDAD